MQSNFIYILGTACKCDLRGTQFGKGKYCFMKQLPCKNVKGQLYTEDNLDGPSKSTLYSNCELDNDPTDPLVNCPVYNRLGNAIGPILEFNIQKLFINRFSSKDD